MKLKLTQIRLDGGTQPRAKIDENVAVEYAELMASGVQFPPVLVFHDGDNYWLADGFHRYRAVDNMDQADIECEVRQGTLQDAQWFSTSANKDHGLQRSNDDKARAVQAALRLRPEMNDCDIARHVGVHRETVAKYRQASCGNSARCAPSQDQPPPLAPDAPDAGSQSGSRTVTRGGRTYEMNVGRIGRSFLKHPGKQSMKTVRTGRSMPTKTALELPHDPASAANTLISFFDRPFIEGLVSELSRYLQTQGEQR